MDHELEARGGWQAAIDAPLVARLLRPAVRPGVGDPAHGPAVAARLQRMAAPTLAHDVALRYGTTPLDAGRPPVVYATPPIQAASMDSRRDATELSGPLRKDLDAGRPVVQGRERAAGPVFPPLRPLGAETVQRMADPAAAVPGRADAAAPVQRRADPGAAVQRKADPAAAVPVAVAHRTGTAGTASTGPRGAERSVSGRPVVAPVPTRLQRQIAAEHAEAVPSAAPALPLVQATRMAGGGGTGEGAAAATIGERASGSASPGAARGAVGTDVVQRRTDPAASHPPRVEEHPEPEGMLPAPLPIVVVRPGGAAGSETKGSTASAALPVASAPAPAGSGGTGGGVIQRVRAHPAEAWSARGGAGDGGGGGSSGARPVVAPRSGSGGTAVQRMAIPGGAGAGPGGPAPRMVHAAPPAVVQRTTPKPPAGAPPATLPTMTARDVGPGPGAAGESSPAELAERVYALLLQRLKNERKQRGW